MTNEVFTPASFVALALGFAVSTAIARISTSTNGVLSQVLGAQKVEIIIGSLAFIATILSFLASMVTSMSGVPEVLLMFFFGYVAGSGTSRVGKALLVKQA
jgi:hypothetical protein